MVVANGLIPDASLASIPGGGRLLVAVAAGWAQLCAEVHRLYGWTPTPTGPLDAYRPLATQRAIFLARYQTSYAEYAKGEVDRRVWNGVSYWRKPGQAAAAVPGTSNHGLGCAVDVTGLSGFDGLRYHQLAAVAARFGWTNTEGRGIDEPWHWVDVGNAYLISNGLSTVGVAPTAPALTPLAPLTPLDIEEMDRMDLWDRVQLIRNKSGATVAVCPDGKVRAVTFDAWNTLGNLGVRDRLIPAGCGDMDPTPWNALVAMLGYGS